MKIQKNYAAAGWTACMAALLAAGILTGCTKQEQVTEAAVPEVVLAEQTLAPTQADETVMALTPDGPILPSVAGLEAEYSEPIPDYLRLGMRHPIVEILQKRLMDLGFMDNDEPTDFYGDVTQNAMKIYQRQNNLSQDGIVGPETLKAVLSPNAKYYAAANGDEGDDIMRIQNRLYELGYLAGEGDVTGFFGDTTETAVKKLQSMNNLEQDGKVGRMTLNLLYSDEVKPNLLAYGEKSDLVLEAQKRLKALGYMTSEPDGTYGNDTILAVKLFQSRNDQIVDGYLGPSTRLALNSDQAVPNGLRIGDSGGTVLKVQTMLSKLGYMKSANATGYFGEVTENAVKIFQRTNRLTVDGLVGAQTMAMLTEGKAKKAPAGTANQVSRPQNTTSSTGNTGNAGSSGSSGAGTGTPNTGSASGSAAALIAVAKSKLGSPYVWGAKGPNAFDCSGFVYWCLNQVGVRQSYMTSSGWRNAGRYTKVSRFSDLRAGDIVVVTGHVGIVAEGGTVVDASSGNGRVVHRSLGSWWAKNFITGWRIF